MDADRDGGGEQQEEIAESHCAIEAQSRPD
jgi:hypothetical protein